jgi:hypothetical protein
MFSALKCHRNNLIRKFSIIWGKVCTALRQAVRNQVKQMDDIVWALLLTAEGGSFYKSDFLCTFYMKVGMDTASEMAYMFLFREQVKLNSTSVRIPNDSHKPFEPQSRYTRLAFNALSVPTEIVSPYQTV